MDRLFGKLDDLLRILFGDSPGPHPGRAADPDLREAWDELEEYLRTGRNPSRPRATSSARSSTPPPPPPRIDESLRRDYANLQVPFGAPIERVRQSYKQLLRKYHPDNFAADPEKQQAATRITQELNASFLRIRRHVENRKNY